MDLVDGEFYWIEIYGKLEVARYDERGWSTPTWDRVAMDDITRVGEETRIIQHVERP